MADKKSAECLLQSLTQVLVDLKDCKDLSSVSLLDIHKDKKLLKKLKGTVFKIHSKAEKLKIHFTKTLENAQDNDSTTIADLNGEISEDSFSTSSHNIVNSTPHKSTDREEFAHNDDSTILISNGKSSEIQKDGEINTEQSNKGDSVEGSFVQIVNDTISAVTIDETSCEASKTSDVVNDCSEIVSLEDGTDENTVNSKKQNQSKADFATEDDTDENTLSSNKKSQSEKNKTVVNENENSNSTNQDKDSATNADSDNAASVSSDVECQEESEKDSDEIRKKSGKNELCSVEVDSVSNLGDDKTKEKKKQASEQENTENTKSAAEKKNKETVDHNNETIASSSSDSEEKQEVSSKKISMKHKRKVKETEKHQDKDLHASDNEGSTENQTRKSKRNIKNKAETEKSNPPQNSDSNDSDAEHNKDKSTMKRKSRRNIEKKNKKDQDDEVKDKTSDNKKRKKNEKATRSKTKDDGGSSASSSDERMNPIEENKKQKDEDKDKTSDENKRKKNEKATRSKTKDDGGSSASSSDEKIDPIEENKKQKDEDKDKTSDKNKQKKNEKTTRSKTKDDGGSSASSSDEKMDPIEENEKRKERNKSDKKDSDESDTETNCQKDVESPKIISLDDKSVVSSQNLSESGGSGNAEPKPEPTSPLKPMLKLIDINKLMPPGVKPLDVLSPNSKGRKSVTFDSSVIILTSSDDDENLPKVREEPLKSDDDCTRLNSDSDPDNPKRRSGRNKEKRLKQTRKMRTIEVSDDSSNDSDYELCKKSRIEKNKIQSKLKFAKLKEARAKRSDVIKKNSEKENSIKGEKKQSKKSKPAESSEDTDESDCEFRWEKVDRNDPKFTHEVRISLPKFNTEDMGDLYKRKKEVFAVKRSEMAPSKKSKSTKKSEEPKVKKLKISLKKDQNKVLHSSDSERSSTEDNLDKNKKTVKNKNQKSKPKRKKEEEEKSETRQEKDSGSEEDTVANKSEKKSKENEVNRKECEEDDDKNQDNESKNNKNKSKNGKTQKNTSNEEDSDIRNEPSTNGDVNDSNNSESNSENTKEDKQKDKDNSESESECETTKNKKKDSDNESVDKEGEDKENEDVEDKKRKKNKDTDSDSASDKEKNKQDKKKQKIGENEVTVLSDDSEDEIVATTKKKKQAAMKKKVLISDSEDSDGEKNNKKKEDSDSDSEKKSDKSSDDSSNSGSDKDEEEESQTRRKRIRREDNSSSDDDDKSTRKSIRKLIDKDSLSDTTKRAEADEKERKARIAEKQKKYNQLFELKSGAVADKIILDFDEKKEKELLTVHKKLVKNLKPHQVDGVKFMWDACFESIERVQKTKGSGCILAHCMGLGKTLQVITLAHTLLTNSKKTKVEKVMVVSPVNTVLNWRSEFKKWLPKGTEFEIFDLVSCRTSSINYERSSIVQDWHENGGVLIIGYNMFRTLSNPDNKGIPKKIRPIFQKGLVDPGPDLVVCDEGHLLKNEKTNLSIAMNRIKTLRRIVLTGTPLQNNLKEYWCMVQFIKPNLLGTYKEYLNRFVNPIINGQYTDSTLHDIQLMRKRSHVLHKLLDGVVQRQDYCVLAPYLPPKYEFVLFINLTEVQKKLYRHYMDNLARRGSDGSNRTSFLFVDFQELQRVCTHPRVLMDKSKEDKVKINDDEEDSEGSLKDFIDDGSDTEESSTDESSNDSGSDSSSSVKKRGKKKKKKEKKVVSGRLTRAQRAQKREIGVESDSDVEILTPKEWWQQFIDGDELDNIDNSGKMQLLFQVLKECEEIGDKVLVFSQSLYTLNCIEYFLQTVDEASQSGDTSKLGGYSGSWALGLDYFRLFLISTKAGGLGINLVAANRVIIFDVSWNPSHDIQSIYRVYRFGQTKPCYIYRFVSYGTMEMKIYERQVTKQAISKRVIDEQQIDRHYSQNDIMELYKVDLDDQERPIPLVPKDVLLGEMLQKYDKTIFRYHEHQSLLENKEEQGLSEEERKAAWEEFENEKVMRQTTTSAYNLFSSALNNSALAGQLTFSPTMIQGALFNIVRNDNPTWADTQIRGILPALIQQLQVQMSEGDFSMYTRVQNEVRLMQAAFQQQEAQRLQQAMYQRQLAAMQQQMMQNKVLGNMQLNPALISRMLQQQQSGNAAMMQNMFRPPFAGAAASSKTSTAAPPAQKKRGRPSTISSEVIDLND